MNFKWERITFTFGELPLLSPFAFQKFFLDG